jgi:hypothetical protein
VLLEKELIQSTGFRNVREGGSIVGFQFRVRMPSYRGMAASLIDGIGDAGYTGYLSSEYEGEREPWRSIEQVPRQQSLMRQTAARL